MEALKAQIASMKKRSGEAAGVSAGQLAFRRKGDEAEQQKREYLERQRALEAEREAKRQQQLEEERQRKQRLYPHLDLAQLISGGEGDAASGAEAFVSKLPPEEVKRQLRKFGEPVTLFGELDIDREKRLRAYKAEHENDAEGRDDADAQYLGELRRLDKEAEQALALGQVPRKKVSADDRVDILEAKHDPADNPHHYVYAHLLKVLRAWEASIEAQTPAYFASAEGKAESAKVAQTRNYLKPLFKLLAKKKLAADILTPLVSVVKHLEVRNYVAANKHYIDELSVGRAAWPMGVTMVGIHMRAAREKISSDEISHVMNDETQRRYIQCVKRLITFQQSQQPNTDNSLNIRF